MRGSNPRRPAGADSQSRFHQSTHDRKIEDSLRDSSTVKVSRTSRGVFLHVRPGASSPATTGLVFRGEYSNVPSDYTKDNIVVVSATTNTGTYICRTVSGPASTDPWAGAPDWALLPGPGLGPWV
jgi:hypothetical protein